MTVTRCHFSGSSGKRVPAQFTGEEGDCKNVIPAKAGIQEGWLGLAKHFFIYIMASRPNGTLHIGVTSNLIKEYGITNRVWLKDSPANTRLECLPI